MPAHRFPFSSPLLAIVPMKSFYLNCWLSWKMSCTDEAAWLGPGELWSDWETLKFPSSLKCCDYGTNQSQLINEMTIATVYGPLSVFQALCWDGNDITLNSKKTPANISPILWMKKLGFRKIKHLSDGTDWRFSHWCSPRIDSRSAQFHALNPPLHQDEM